MRFCNNFLGLFLIDAGDRHIERDRQHKSALTVRLHSDRRDHGDIVVLHLVCRRARHVDDGILETGGVAAGKKLLGIRGVTLAAKRFG